MTRRRRQRSGLLAATLAVLVTLTGCVTTTVDGAGDYRWPAQQLKDPDNIPELQPLSDLPSWDEFTTSLEESIKRGQKNGTVKSYSRLQDIYDTLKDADHNDPRVQAVMRQVMRLAEGQSQMPSEIQPSGKGAKDGDLTWIPCGDDGLECTTLKVPIDYDDPDGDSIHIRINRYKARDADKRIGVLYTNPGGPGASGVDFLVSKYADFDDELKDRYDIIGFDPRGVARSDPIKCGTPSISDDSVSENPQTQEEEDAFTAWAEAQAEACLDAGPLLEHVGTKNVARDMDEMRKAMGEEQISYLGYSYGTELGQAYANLFPDQVRVMVLDGVVDTGISKQELDYTQSRGFDLALRRFTEWCPETCIGLPAYVLEKAGQDPIPAEFLSSEDSMSATYIQIVLSRMLYSESTWPIMSWGLREAAVNNDSTLLSLILDQLVGRSIFDGSFGGGSGGSGDSFNAIECEDFDVEPLDKAYADSRREARQFPIFARGPSVLCNVWKTERDPLGALTWPKEVPVVLVSTTGDPATPHTWAKSVAQRNTSAVLVTYNGDGHAIYARENECINDPITKFLIEGELPKKGIVCQRE